MRGYIKPKVDNPVVENLKRKRTQEKEMEEIINRKINELKPLIDVIFVNYKAFMHWSTECSYETRQINSKKIGKTLAEIIPTFFAVNEPHIYPLVIDSLNLSKPEYFCKSLFFHEFTHLYDLEQPKLIKIRKDGSLRAFSFITEAHASEIELMCQLGFNAIDSDLTVTLSTKLTESKGQPTILEHLQQRYKVIQDVIGENLPQAFKHYQYYLGILRFLLKRNVFTDCQFEETTNIKAIANRFGDTNMKIANAVFSGKFDMRTIKIIEDELDRINLTLIFKGITNTLFSAK